MNKLEIREFRKRHNLTQQQLADLTGVGVRTVKSWEYGERNISNSAIVIIENYTPNGYAEKPPKASVVNDVKEKYYTNTLSVKVVTTKARAGFSESYYSEEYLDDLPTILIEADKEYKGNYLAFEVDGDSMEPEYNAGDVVICREVQRSLWQYKLHYKDFDFVIAHGTKGIMLKEIRSHDPETGEILCHSLNDSIKDFTLNLREVAFLYNVVEHRISGKSKRRNR